MKVAVKWCTHPPAAQSLTHIDRPALPRPRTSVLPCPRQSLSLCLQRCADLEQVSGRRDQYKKCANLLEAVHQLMDYFQQYESIPKVRISTTL